MCHLGCIIFFGKFALRRTRVISPGSAAAAALGVLRSTFSLPNSSVFPRAPSTPLDFAHFCFFCIFYLFFIYTIYSLFCVFFIIFFVLFWWSKLSGGGTHRGCLESEREVGEWEREGIDLAKMIHNPHRSRSESESESESEPKRWSWRGGWCDDAPAGQWLPDFGFGSLCMTRWMNIRILDHPRRGVELSARPLLITAVHWSLHEAQILLLLCFFFFS